MYIVQIYDEKTKKVAHFAATGQDEQESIRLVLEFLDRLGLKNKIATKCQKANDGGVWVVTGGLL